MTTTRLLFGCLMLLSPTYAPAAIIQLTASLDDVQETTCGPSSTARGEAVMTLDDVSGLFSWNIEFGNNAPDFDNGLLDLGDESSAHFHGPAAPGQIGGITVPLPLGSPKIGDANVSPSDVTEITSGLWYVNVHSDGCPGGEIRGQVEVVPGPPAEIGVSAVKFIAVDKLTAAGKSKTAFVSKDQSAGITKGSGTSLDDISVRFDVAYEDGSAEGAFVVPAGASNGTEGWLANKATVAKFVNKAAPSGSTGAKVAVIKPGKLLKIIGKSLGDDALDILGAGGPSTGVVTSYCVTNDGATFCHCSQFANASCSWKSIAGGTGAKLVCKGGVADGDCDAVASPSGAFLD